jgi:hypothetical protein
MILYVRSVCPVLIETAVQFRVFLLRRRGRQRPWREVQNGPSYVGEVITHSVDVKGQRYQIATVRPADPMRQVLIPELYEPVLLGFWTLAFRLRGFERVDDSANGQLSVVQEWHCEAP